MTTNLPVVLSVAVSAQLSTLAVVDCDMFTTVVEGEDVMLDFPSCSVVDGVVFCVADIVVFAVASSPAAVVDSCIPRVVRTVVEGRSCIVPLRNPTSSFIIHL